jgi:hypothetical protein
LEFIILSAVLYLYETWYLTSKKEHRLRMSENRVLRRTCGPRRDEMAGGWRKLQNEKLHSLHPSSYIIKVINSRKMRWTEHVARMRAMRNAYKILGEKPKGKRPLERPKRGWRILLKWILGKQGLGCELDSYCSG